MCVRLCVCVYMRVCVVCDEVAPTQLSGMAKEANALSTSEHAGVHAAYSRHCGTSCKNEPESGKPDANIDSGVGSSSGK